MREAIAATAGLAIFFGSACGSGGGGTTGSSTGEAVTGSGTSSGGGSPTTGGTTGRATTGGTTGSADGTACTSNAACQSGVCGLNGSGNCCSVACRTDDAVCAASACDNTGACTYPSAGGPCNSSCLYGVFTASLCDGSGACSPQKPVACPNNLSCNSAGTACQGTCDPANGAADCSPGWYCSGTTCTPQIQLGACTTNAECQSNVCGIGGSGHCCTQTACTNNNTPCGATDCDGVTGACSFPPTTQSCASGAVTCPSGSTQSNPNTYCDGIGDCLPPVLTDCSPYACEVGAGGCVSSCTSIADCSKDFYCNGGSCVPQNAIGPCTENDACLSFQCGATGTGNCCFNPCGSTDPSCGITDCDPNDGSCSYVSNTTACGTILESCSAGTQQNPSLCDGLGNCPPPGVTPCAPFICGTTACLTSCTDNTSCAPGDQCSVAAGICCPALLSGGSLNVDSANGSDTAACCGIPGYTECQTIGHAMQLIDAAKATDVTINAYIGGLGSGGDWTFGGSGDSVPITLGWGVELNAPGVAFAPNWYNLGYNNYNFCVYPEIFDINAYSANDTVGYASITGTAAGGAVQVGISSGNNGVVEGQENTAIMVETGQRLYIGNANVSGNYENYYSQCDGSSAAQAGIIVAAGAHLTLGQDKSAANLGTVTIGGTTASNSAFWGYQGIVCQSDYVSQGCTIDDAALPTGTSSVLIADNRYLDIDAEDFANISLLSAPQIGLTPSSTGFRNCSNKIDGAAQYNTSGAAMIWLNGAVNMTFSNGMVGCLAGDAFYLQASSNGNGNPSLTLTNTTVQNTERAIYASAGKATVSGSTFVYNYNGVEQDTDGSNDATIDLSGGSNILACTSHYESVYYSYRGITLPPSVAALNTTGSNLDADNVAWDTASPDLFNCSPLTTCTCEAASCANAGGVDGMDAVYEGNGTVTTNANTVSTFDCTAPIPCYYQGFCTGTETCCDVFEECLPQGECPGSGGCGKCGICGFCGICGRCGGCGGCGGCD